MTEHVCVRDRPISRRYAAPMRFPISLLACALLTGGGCGSSPSAATDDEEEVGSESTGGGPAATSDDPCGDLPCPLDSDGHMALDCLCALIDCPIDLETALQLEGGGTVSSRQCDDQVVVSYGSQYYAEAFGYQNGQLSSAYVDDHGDGSCSLWYHTPKFPAPDDCEERCLLFHPNAEDPEPGTCLDEEDLGFGGSPIVK